MTGVQTCALPICFLQRPLPLLESKVVVLLGSMAVGVNVYLMSQKFNVITGPAAASMLFSTVFAAVTTPIWMMLMTLAGY